MSVLEPTPHQTAFAEMWEGICTLALIDIGPSGKWIKGTVWDSKQLLGDHWRCWINATDQNQEVANGYLIKPFHMYVEFNGWPAGICDPHTGLICAGEAADVFTLRDAIHHAIARVGAAK
jgi:hypothetical protein